MNERTTVAVPYGILTDRHITPMGMRAIMALLALGPETGLYRRQIEDVTRADSGNLSRCIGDLKRLGYLLEDHRRADHVDYSKGNLVYLNLNHPIFEKVVEQLDEGDE